jgi:hypothetical protein
VLISDNGHIQLAGFGRIMVAQDQEVAEDTWLTGTTQTSVGAGMTTMRWLAPELFEDSESAPSQPTASSDVFAYGSLLYMASDTCASSALDIVLSKRLHPDFLWVASVGRVSVVRDHDPGHERGACATSTRRPPANADAGALRPRVGGYPTLLGSQSCEAAIDGGGSAPAEGPLFVSQLGALVRLGAS